MPKEDKPAVEMSTAEAIRQLAEAIQSRNPSDLEKSGISAERQARVQGTTSARAFRDVMGIGENGSTFLIHVVKDPEYSNGRCVWFLQYKHPDGLWKSKAMGGRVPDGMRIAFDRTGEGLIATLTDSENVPQGVCTKEYLLWRRAEFHAADYAAIIGKNLKSHFCDPAGKGMNTPWIDPDAHVQAQRVDQI